MKYVLVVTAADGSIAVVGPFPHEYAATVHGNSVENYESGLTANVYPLEAPEDPG